MRVKVDQVTVKYDIYANIILKALDPQIILHNNEFEFVIQDEIPWSPGDEINYQDFLNLVYHHEFFICGNSLFNDSWHMMKQDDSSIEDED